MAETTDDQQQSYNSVQSPLKPRHNEGGQKGEKAHTDSLDVGEAAFKGEYELARDKRVAALQEYLRPVQTAANAL